MGWNAVDHIKKFYKENKPRASIQKKESASSPHRTITVHPHLSKDENTILHTFCVNLTKKAEEKKLPPFIGRTEEINNIITVLSRKTKDNPLLVGEPGVGKTALIEGLAIQIVKNMVPENLQGKIIYSLNLTSMMEDTQYRGVLEKRLATLMHILEKSQGNILLFIDEIHKIVGTGGTPGTGDIANIFKPALARGELHCIGATTTIEYKNFIEKDAALARRFQLIRVETPSIEDTITILRGLKETFEIHHGISIQDNALIAAVKLSEKYITNRFLPDKAIDVIDQAAAQLNCQLHSKPKALAALEQKQFTLEMEKQSLKKESDSLSINRSQELTDELQTLKQRIMDFNAQMKKDKNTMKEIQRLKANRVTIRAELDECQRDKNADRASDIYNEKFIPLEAHIKKAEAEIIEHLPHQISNENIAEVVSTWTGIPLKKLLAAEIDKFLNMEETLKKKIFGQDDALKAVSDAIQCSYAGLHEARKPIGAFLFLGPTGVGKTQTAKVLAEFLFDTESAIIRLDMTEYQEPHSVSRLIGSPPGYVGYHEGGKLTEEVRKKPHSIILCDEIEKAHTSIHNIFLQILDDGRLTDGQGHTISFSNTLIIMTSNLGSQAILKEKDPIIMRTKINEAVEKAFKPEFIGRISDRIIFLPLKNQEYHQILNKLIEDLNVLLKEKKLTLQLDDSVKNHLLQIGTDQELGARPLEEAFTRKIRNVLARKILANTFPSDSTINVFIDNQQMIQFE